MTNLDRLLEKSRELREQQIIFPTDEIAIEVEKMLTIAVEALRKIYMCELPVSEIVNKNFKDAFIDMAERRAAEAFSEIEALAAKALGESES